LPTSHDDIFLQDILAAPDDDTPRLLYADWLEDNGDAARAEFIRVQCRLARALPGDPCLSDLRRREHELLGQHGPAWRRPVPAWLRGGVISRRGFIDEFSGGAGALFRDDPRDFWAVAPTTTVLRLAGISPAAADLTRLVAMPELSRLRVLELSARRLPGGWIAGCLELDAAVSLRTLRLTHCSLLDSGLAALLEKAPIGTRMRERPWLERLEHLGLAGNQFTDGCVAALLDSLTVARLRSLDLGGNLFSSPVVARLRAHLGPRLHFGGQDTERISRS
jgi:uncharacterized protein (TIGR02996 family)